MKFVNRRYGQHIFNGNLGSLPKKNTRSRGIDSPGNGFTFCASVRNFYNCPSLLRKFFFFGFLLVILFFCDNLFSCRDCYLQTQPLMRRCELLFFFERRVILAWSAYFQREPWFASQRESPEVQEWVFIETVLHSVPFCLLSSFLGTFNIQW